MGEEGHTDFFKSELLEDAVPPPSYTVCARAALGKRHVGLTAYVNCIVGMRDVDATCVETK